MFTRTRGAAVAVAVALVALAAVPAVASAATPQLRGVVSGSPYGASNNTMAVPILFSKMTVRAARLKSPVGVVILKRTQKVTLPGGGWLLPVNLRAGDRIKGSATVSASNRRSYYPSLPLTKKAAVYFRSKEMSAAELTAAVDALRKALADLAAQVNALRSGSIKAFQDLYAQLADLRKALAALSVPVAGADLTSIQSQIDALNKKLNDLAAGLPDFSQFALISQLPDLSQYVKLSDLSTLLGSNITTLQGQVSTLQGQVSTLQGQVQTLTTKLGAVCSALNVPAITTLAPALAGACAS
jgi:polyhydroxyalkanoate synthesis regulator phasin